MCDLINALASVSRVHTVRIFPGSSLEDVILPWVVIG